MTVNLTCSGPGPHIPASGILGTASAPVAGLRCSSAACDPENDPATQAAAAAVVVAKTLADRASAALAANATYIALPTPTAAQTTAQVQRLTRECSALIRLMLQAFDSANGT